MNKTIETRIQDLIHQRAQINKDIKLLIDKWKDRKKTAGELKRVLTELSSVVKSPRNAYADTSSMSALESFLRQMNETDMVQKLIGLSGKQLTLLERLSKRFHRDTINIAVAGVGRSGKSTAIKSLLGLSQEDNHVIPSREGPAVTAGKSVITCVLTQEEERPKYNIILRIPF